MSTLDFGAFQSNAFQFSSYQTAYVYSPPIVIDGGGAFQHNAFQYSSFQTGYFPQNVFGGGGVDHQRKRRKATISDKPNQHLDKIIETAFKTVFSELTSKKIPKEIQKQANKIVRDYTTEYRPSVNDIDWAEFNRDLEAVQLLFNLYNRELVERNRAINEKRMFDFIENDNLEFLLMH